MKIKLKDKIFEYRFATPKDVNKIYRFDRRINSVQEDHQYYYSHSPKNILKKMSFGNKIYMVFYKSRLIAWATIYTSIDKKRISNFNLSLADSKKSGLLCAAAVSRKYRGYGIQKFLIKIRIDYLKKKHIKFVFVMVSPGNKYSLNNIKLFGFKFVKKIISEKPEIINHKRVMVPNIDYNYRLNL